MSANDARRNMINLAKTPILTTSWQPDAMAAKGPAMKLWFTKKTPKDIYDGKAPYDATVEQVLRVAREVNATPAEAERDSFDFSQAFRAEGEPAKAVEVSLSSLPTNHLPPNHLQVNSLPAPSPAT